MERVLLAVDGIAPNRKVFRYAVELCKRIQAELTVFQIIHPKKYSKHLKEIRKKVSHTKVYIEGSMMAATFAEAGEHETAEEIMSEALNRINRLVSESKKEGVQCHFSIKPGNPEKEIVNYVNGHRDVVLTIYDGTDEDTGRTGILSKKKSVLSDIKERLHIPLVVVNA